MFKVPVALLNIFPSSKALPKRTSFIVVNNSTRCSGEVALTKLLNSAAVTSSFKNNLPAFSSVVSYTIFSGRL